MHPQEIFFHTKIMYLKASTGKKSQVFMRKMVNGAVDHEMNL